MVGCPGMKSLAVLLGVPFIDNDKYFSIGFSFLVTSLINESADHFVTDDRRTMILMIEQ